MTSGKVFLVVTFHSSPVLSANNEIQKVSSFSGFVL